MSAVSRIRPHNAVTFVAAVFGFVAMHAGEPGAAGYGRVSDEPLRG